MRSTAHLVLRRLGPWLALSLAACTPPPIYKTPADAVTVTPTQLAQSPNRVTIGDAIWGGRIVQISNFPDHSEIELLAFPLDPSQRPQPNDSGNGRFIAVVHGVADPRAFPVGALMTLSGKLDGTRAGKVGEAPYVFPLLNVEQSHLWTARELSQGDNIHFGVGVGVGVH